MVRGKTQMRRIENATSRQVTFSKRRNGLLKKAFELSVLCDAEIALIIFSPRGKLYQFSNSSMQDTIERYRRHLKDNPTNKKPTEENMEQLNSETADMVKKIEFLETSKRKLLGEGIASCTIEELQQIEQLLERSVSNVRDRKNQVFKERIEKLREREKALVAENAMLYEKRWLEPFRVSNDRRESMAEEDGGPVSEVETELFIGPPETRRVKRFPPRN
ncbi:hypothetical protein K2173_024812 [Erythroxylum novogranatense]|uniref:Uncharacterized protein n=1 Tax=Erythroxylum novogranatense TaxID=1862640 RepID=A0AAV8UG10_9ROSI|nr:hypothetical protein K2173_024812 [Erythroxylum novogranatense]